MEFKIAKATLVAAALFCAALPATAQTNRYVRTSGSDTANDCASSVTPCATIQHAVDEANTGDTVNIGTGIFVGGVSIEKGLTISCAQDGTSPSARTPVGISETKIVWGPGVSDYLFQIRTSNVAIRGCDLYGFAAVGVWTGIKIWNSGSATDPDDISNIDIKQNFIHDFHDANPGGTFNYAYGIWAMGGGSQTTTRGTISDLVIDDNSFFAIGDLDIGGPVTVATEQAGVGVYIKSISGLAAGDGAKITNNTFDDIGDGYPSATTLSAGVFIERGVSIFVGQDTETSTLDDGVLIQGNTHGDSDIDGPYVGVVIQTAASDVAESLASFGSQAIPLILNLSHPDFSTLPLATIDLADMSTATTSVYAVDNLTSSAAAGITGSVGYFRTLLDAAGATTSTNAVMPQPRDGSLNGAILTLAGTSLVFTFANGDTFTIPIADYVAAGLTPSLIGGTGDETFKISPNVFEAVPSLFVSGGAGTDGIEFLAYGGDCTLTRTTHNPTSTSDGTAVFEGTSTGGTCAGFNSTVTYAGLEPIDDSANFPLARVFNFDAAAETITLSDDGAPNDNVSFIGSGLSESWTFGNPTVSLEINALGGGDTLNLGLLDTSGGTLPAITVTANGGSGADVFNVTPADGYTSLTVNGGAPATCPGDVLNIAVPAAVTADYSVAGTVTFSGTTDPVTYTGMEAIANFVADLAVASTTTLYPGDLLDFTVTVTNNGPDAAQCVTVFDVLPTGLQFITGPTLSDGYVIGNDWLITSILNGTSATLSGQVFVNTSDPTTVVVGSLSTDGNSANDSIEFVGQGFNFPDNTYIQDALIYEFVVSGVSFERLIVGLYQGSPSLNSAILCRIPDPDGVVFDVNPDFVRETWRECGEGLPYPLHPNDLYLDEDTGRIWLATWGAAGLYFSDDGGLTFEQAWPGLGPGDVTIPAYWANVYAITADSEDILCISANHGTMYRSLNGGDTWQLIGSLPWIDSDTPWSLEAHPTVAGTVYAGTMGRGVFITTDYGLTWDPLVPSTSAAGYVTDELGSAANGAGFVFDLKFSPDFPDLLFAGTGNGVWAIDTSAPTAWTDMGLEVSYEEGAVTVTTNPEVRGLVFGLSDGDADLYLATWGFGLYVDEDPTNGGTLTPTSTFEVFTLRGTEVTFVTVAPGGMVWAGSTDSDLVRLKAPDATSTEAVRPDALPTAYALDQNYPNPFNPVTTVTFALPEAAHVRLAVYDLLGREVATLADGLLEAGSHRVQFDAAGLPSGAYLYRLTTPATTVTRQMMLLK